MSVTESLLQFLVLLHVAHACLHGVYIREPATCKCWTAQVCRAAGYFQHALFVCQAAAETQWYLDILLEDVQSWEDALAYLQDLPRQQAAAALKKHGKVCQQPS